MISVILSEHSPSLCFLIKALPVVFCGAMRNKMSAESTEMTTTYQPTEQERSALEAHDRQDKENANIATAHSP